MRFWIGITAAQSLAVFDPGQSFTLRRSLGRVVRQSLDAAGKQGAVINGGSDEVHEALCEWLRKHGVKDRKPVHYLRKC